MLAVIEVIVELALNLCNINHHYYKLLYSTFGIPKLCLL